VLYQDASGGRVSPLAGVRADRRPKRSLDRNWPRSCLREKRRITRRFIAELGDNIGPYTDIPAPDLYTDSRRTRCAICFRFRLRWRLSFRCHEGESTTARDRPMLQLRHEQLEALKAARRQEVAARIADHLERRFAPHLRRQGIEPPELPAIVDAAVVRGLELRLRSERDLRIFCEACACVGFDFPDDAAHADIRSALERTPASQAKAALIDEYLMIHHGA
jgi:hypothetical protein